MSGPIERLYDAVLKARYDDHASSRTARLFQAGRSKMGKKLVEEAAEVTIDAIADDRPAVIRESADLLYNLAVLWAEMAIEPHEVWSEMERREQLYGIAEKLHKGPVAVNGMKRR